VGNRDVEAVTLEVPAHDIAHDGVVVGDQHSRHKPRLARHGHYLRRCHGFVTVDS
jgi:hypothetical protein